MAIVPGSSRSSTRDRSGIDRPEVDAGLTQIRCVIPRGSILNRPGYDPVRPGIDAGLPGIDQGSIRVDQGWIRSLCSIRYRSAVDPSRSRSTWDRSGVSPGSVRDRPGVGPRSGAKQEGTGDRPGVCPAPTQCQLRCQPNVSPGANPTSARCRPGIDQGATPSRPEVDSRSAVNRGRPGIDPTSTRGGRSIRGRPGADPGSAR